MKYLIDTHILIWFRLNDKKLKANIYAILTNPDNKIFVSDVSLYEITVKKKINKLPDFIATIDDIVFVAQQDKFHFLPIAHTHFLSYDSVPFFNYHPDPFDRLIIATALSENLTIISADEKFKLYLPDIQLIEA